MNNELTKEELDQKIDSLEVGLSKNLLDYFHNKKHYEIDDCLTNVNYMINISKELYHALEEKEARLCEE
jgi:hypothetical protein